MRVHVDAGRKRALDDFGELRRGTYHKPFGAPL